MRNKYEDEVPFTNTHRLRRGYGGGYMEDNVSWPEARANIFSTIHI